MVLYLGLLVAIALQTALSAVTIWIVARWCKAERAAFVPALLSALAVVALSLLFVAPLPFLTHRVGGVGPLLLGWAATLPIQIALQWYVLTKAHRVATGQAWLMWLAQLGAGATFWLTAAALALPFVAEAFVSPTNAMCPTLRGYHQDATCSLCGGKAAVPSPAPAIRAELHSDELESYHDSAICENCLAVAPPAEVNEALQRPDRFLVNKVRTVRRWDVAVFRYPEQPEVLYISRVVGLPSETVEIKDGSVLINGKIAQPPAELKGLKYELPGGDPLGVDFANEEEPLQLGEEFFVLGDFSVRSHDSRFWGPVPADHMRGVLTARYWPPQRWEFWP